MIKRFQVGVARILQETLYSAKMRHGISDDYLSVVTLRESVYGVLLVPKFYLLEIACAVEGFGGPTSNIIMQRPSHFLQLVWIEPKRHGVIAVLESVADFRVTIDGEMAPLNAHNVCSFRTKAVQLPDELLVGPARELPVGEDKIVIAQACRRQASHLGILTLEEPRKICV